MIKNIVEYKPQALKMNEKGQSIVYEEYKKRMKEDIYRERDIKKKERARLGDLLLEEGEIEPVERKTEQEKDKEIFDKYIRSGLVNI